MEIIGVVVLVVLAIPVGLVYALYQIGKLQGAQEELRREIAALRRDAFTRPAEARDEGRGAGAASAAEPPSRERPEAPPYTTPGPERPAHPSPGTAARGAEGAPPPPTEASPTPPSSSDRRPERPAASTAAASGPDDSRASGSESADRPDTERATAGAPDDGGPKREGRQGEEAGQAAPPPPTPAGLDVEAAIGSTWLLRIGLGILAIALALFARLVAPQLSPLAKVVVAYAGAMAFFAVGKVFEERLDRFAKPVMAGGLAFGFFVAFAAHFVPAMQAVSLPVSIAWMSVSMLAVLVAAERWRSESTAVLAIVLGHVSAQVSAGAADIYSLVMIGFLALTALLLLLRHGWIQLGLLGVVASYGAHLLWMLADRQPPVGNQGFWLSLAFLTSYYLIFLAADLLWWYRQPEIAEGEDAARRLRDARALGPVNLVLYVSLTTFLYLASGAMVESVEWYYLTLGALQGALALLYRSLDHRDYVFYPVFGTILWTIGLFAWLDALVLNLVLASQALLLLMVARRTELRVFYLLSQAMTGAAFVHYFAYPPPPPGMGPFLGGLAIASVYLVKADLEESWSDLPFLPQLHAVLGGIVILREANGYFAFLGWWGAFLAFAAVLLTVAALARRRTTLLFAVSAMAAGMLFVFDVASHDPVWAAATGFLAAALVMVVAGPRLPELQGSTALTGHARAVSAFVLVGALFAADGLGPGLLSYLLWILIPTGVLATQLRADHLVGEGEDPHQLVIFAYFAVGLLVLVITGEATSQLMQPVWAWTWAMAALACYGWLRYRGLSLAGFTILLGGALVFLNLSLLAVPDFASGHPTLSSWLTGPFLVVIPFVLGWWLDRRAGPVTNVAALGSEEDLETSLHPFLLYFLGLMVTGAVAAELADFGWIYLAPALVGLLLALAGRRASRIRPLVAAAMGATTWQVHFLANGTQARQAAESLWALLAFAVAGLVVERMAHGGLAAAAATAGDGTAAPPDDGATTPSGPATSLGWVLMGLVILATLSGMLALQRSDLAGGPWTTVGWSVWAGLLMTAAFTLRSAIHRRVALGLLVLCIVRVFAVDTVGLSDTARVGAFLILGLVLVGIALLYNRYSEELKSWL
ncbi:MAG: DUF2339 domain-containing protein [Longimicrobiales bacterium]|nr:DUF2339 domain-containing protein [Longimicrobiales bacterium]